MMVWLLLPLCLGHCLPAVLGADSSIEANVGDTATLPCDGPAATDTYVKWMFDGEAVCSYEDGNWCETARHVNRTQLGSIQQKDFTLVINSVRKEDEGVYECRISGEDGHTIRLSVVGGPGREDAEKPPGGGPGREDAEKPPGGGRKRRDAGPVCRPYREREVSPGSETKSKQDSGENPPGEDSGRNRAVIWVSVGTVGIVATVAAVFIRRRRNLQSDENLPGTI